MSAGTIWKFNITITLPYIVARDVRLHVGRSDHLFVKFDQKCNSNQLGAERWGLAYIEVLEAQANCTIATLIFNSCTICQTSVEYIPRRIDSIHPSLAIQIDAAITQWQKASNGKISFAV